MFGTTNMIIAFLLRDYVMFSTSYTAITYVYQPNQFQKEQHITHYKEKYFRHYIFQMRSSLLALFNINFTNIPVMDLDLSANFKLRGRRNAS